VDAIIRTQLPANPGFSYERPMQTITRAGLVTLVFLVGCATGGVASQLVVSPAMAQAEPVKEDEPSWEYSCDIENDVEELNNMATKLGAEGWEMSGQAAVKEGQVVWCFKRAI
jgi:hypothetical protein